MTLEDTAAATANAVSSLTARFMLDGATYARGAELGFAGLDFYAGGRGGVLGDVDADVVSAGLVFFNPDVVRPLWEQSGAVMPRAQAAAEWAACGQAWGRAHLPDDIDNARFAELARRAVGAASPIGAPVFAGWRALPAPPPGDAKAAAAHAMNGLRELRMAVHGLAVVAQGVEPAAAVWFKSPHMAPMFGWPEAPEGDPVDDAWNAAEAATNRLFGARAFGTFDDKEQAEFTELANAAEAATRG